MSKFPWKTALAGAALAATTVYAYAQLVPPAHGPMGMHGEAMHEQMMHGAGGMHGGMAHGMHGTAMRDGQAKAMPASPGQDAFGAILEIVQILQADPNTDWSKVDIEGLRQHLIDMNQVTLHAAATRQVLDNGVAYDVTGEGRTLAAIKRMLPAHVRELRETGWNARTEDLPNGVRLIVIASEAQPLTRLKALGFIGIMVQGGHHQPHHLMMARGEFRH